MPAGTMWKEMRASRTLPPASAANSSSTMLKPWPRCASSAPASSSTGRTTSRRSAANWARNCASSSLPCCSRASSARRRTSYWSSIRFRSASMAGKGRRETAAKRAAAPLLAFGLALERGLFLLILPGRELLLRDLAGDGVRLLDLAGEEVALAGDALQLVVAEPARLLLDL